MNKGDKSARGHIGSEIQNKSETVISVTKDITDKTISNVKHEFARGMDFEDFSFTITGGLPDISENDRDENKDEPF